MRVLITGGAGFIGSALCRYLAGDLGVDILVVDKLTYAANLSSLAPIASGPHYRFARADIADRGAVARLLADFRPHGIINLAAESHVDRSITGAAAFVQTNIVGTYELLEAALAYWTRLPDSARAAFRFHHVSTDEVFGSLGETGCFTERTAYDPSSPYSASKAASDHLVRAWARTYGLPAVISNATNNYGPYHFPEKLIPLMILNALEGRPLPVYGDGSNVRDWLYVEDHCRGLWDVFRKGRPGESYNLGGGNERSNLSIVEAICDILDLLVPDGAPRRRLITFVADRPGHDRRYAVDISKARAELGWEPRETFESGLAKTVRWYLENRAWWEPLRRGVYGGERLGLLEAVAAE